VEDVQPYYTNLVITVNRTGTNTEAVSLRFRINNTLGAGDNADPAEQLNNQFPLQPGSDYATPVPFDALHGRITNDFIYNPVPNGNYTFPNGGTLTWGQNDFQSKTIRIQIINDGT